MEKDQTYKDIESGKYPPTEENEREALARIFELAVLRTREGNYIHAISLAQTAGKIAQGLFKEYPRPLQHPFQR